MKRLRVLVACEESQAVCKAFRELGHKAYSCDLQECSGGHPEWHIKGDALKVLNLPIWDLVIAHPPCTYITNGGAVRMYKKKGVINEERFAKAVQAKEFFNKFLQAKCKHIAVENPVPMTCVGLKKYNQIIQPYQFGDPFSKKTCLWLKGLPPLHYTNVLSEYQPFINGGGGRLNKPNYKGKTFANGQKKRSKTFEGIARAMATQWSEYILKELEEQK